MSESERSRWGVTHIQTFTDTVPKAPQRSRLLGSLTSKGECRFTNGLEENSSGKALRILVYESIEQPYTDLCLSQPKRPRDVAEGDWECYMMHPLLDDAYIQIMNEDTAKAESLGFQLWGVRHRGQEPITQIGFFGKPKDQADPLGINYALELQSEGWTVLPRNLAYFEGCCFIAFRRGQELFSA